MNKYDRYNRTAKGRVRYVRYRKSQKYRAKQRRYRQSENGSWFSRMRVARWLQDNHEERNERRRIQYAIQKGAA